MSFQQFPKVRECNPLFWEASRYHTVTVV